MDKNFEKELPEGYEQIYHINAREKRTALRFNLAAFAITIAVLIIGLIPIFITKAPEDFALGQLEGLIASLVFLLSMIVYIIGHELVHGIAYKALTREKLTFGISLSCAFCGVPSIYTYRKTALIALLAPFTVFTVALVGLCVGMYFIHPMYYAFALYVLGMHAGACIGDLYMSMLCFTRFKSNDILMRDTGPEQFIYSRTPKD